jgi:phosphomannomutase
MNKIFKSYDIRWIYPQEINKDIIYKIWKGYADFLNLSWKKIVVWYDCRKSSKTLFKGLVRWLNEQWVDVINIWLATTPMSYYANWKLGANGSIIITASHNPSEFNWLKLCRENSVPISWETWITQIKNLVEQNICKDIKIKWTIEDHFNIKKDYINFIKSFANNKVIDSKFKVVIDSANAMWILEKSVLDGLVEVINLYDDLDWNFPNHEANPLNYSTLIDVQKKVVDVWADLWIAFDWDADRVWFIDENWNIIESDYIWLLIWNMMLDKTKWSILYDLRSSKIIKENIERNWWTPIESRVWHSFIKKIMRENNAMFASELSWHYYFRENYFTESSSLAVIYILNLIANKWKNISDIIIPYKKYSKIEETNFKVNNKEEIIRKLEKQYSHWKLSKIDWIKITFDDYWFCIRSSNTENLLRLNLEANTKELKESKFREISEKIAKFMI